VDFISFLVLVYSWLFIFITFFVISKAAWSRYKKL